MRRQETDDAGPVARVLAQAFVGEPEVVDLEAALSRRTDSWGLVALAAGRVVGHVRLTRGWVDAPTSLVEVLVLSPLSVEPARQREGVGARLIEAALSLATTQGAVAVFLEGDPGYYARHGWRAAAEIGVTPPSDRIPAPACQVVTLPGYEAWMRGRLVYADTFWALDCVGLRGEVLQRVREDLEG